MGKMACDDVTKLLIHPTSKPEFQRRSQPQGEPVRKGSVKKRPPDEL